MNERSPRMGLSKEQPKQPVKEFLAAGMNKEVQPKAEMDPKRKALRNLRNVLIGKNLDHHIQEENSGFLSLSTWAKIFRVKPTQEALVIIQSFLSDFFEEKKTRNLPLESTTRRRGYKTYRLTNRTKLLEYIKRELGENS